MKRKSVSLYQECRTRGTPSLRNCTFFLTFVSSTYLPPPPPSPLFQITLEKKRLTSHTPLPILFPIQLCMPSSFLQPRVFKSEAWAKDEVSVCVCDLYEGGSNSPITSRHRSALALVSICCLKALRVLVKDIRVRYRLSYDS